VTPQVVVEAGDAHSKLARNVVDLERLVKILAESLNRSGDGGYRATQKGHVTEPVALLSHQEPVHDFPRDQRREDPRFDLQNGTILLDNHHTTRRSRVAIMV
jgi:hypothetical protein